MQNVVVKIDANINWQAFRGPSGAWVGVCDALGLTAQGDTWDELVATLGPSVQMLLEDLLESHELDRYLRDRGWTADHLPQAEHVHFDLPFNLTKVDAPSPAFGHA